MTKRSVVASVAISILLALIAGCATNIGVPPASTKTAIPQAAASQKVEIRYRELAWNDLPKWQNDPMQDAWTSFLASCRSLIKVPMWMSVCSKAMSLPLPPNGEQVKAFMTANLLPWQVLNTDGSTTGLITGYYEPILQVSRARSARYMHPIYAVPQDLIVVDLARLYPELKSFRLRGRLQGQRLIPYWSRAEISAQGSNFNALPLVWAEDAFDVFVLQVQGSGTAQLPDGKKIRIAYAEQNGHPYVAIGKWLVEQRELSVEQADMMGIRTWVKQHPARVEELLNANPSYVFFREETISGNEGPKGSLGIPLTPMRSIAVDTRAIPLGTPVFLDTTYPKTKMPLQRLVFAQDTGGAIKGQVRADLFIGTGAQAGEQAGVMRQSGQLFILWPRGFSPSKLND